MSTILQLTVCGLFNKYYCIDSVVSCSWTKLSTYSCKLHHMSSCHASTSWTTDKLWYAKCTAIPSKIVVLWCCNTEPY